MPPKPSAPTKILSQDVPIIFQRYRTELQNLAQKIGELESEMEEHACVSLPHALTKLTLHNYRSLVLSTLQPLVETHPSRPCYRLIGGILVERTVKDVVPTLETNYSGIKDVLESLVRSYKGKEEDFAGFQREYGISVG
jgi:prefoldin subunit 2